ncbi:MAG: hypothetical protein KGJ13_02205 [Patescibacteria group bacterium]|nr:hypothetical protein [Patescibacteria group bacterium]
MGIFNIILGLIKNNKATTFVGILSLLSAVLPYLIPSLVPADIQTPALTLGTIIIALLQHPKDMANYLVDGLGAVAAIITFVATKEPQTVATILLTIVGAIGALSTELKKSQVTA